MESFVNFVRAELGEWDPRRALRRSMSAGPGRRQPADEPRIDANMGLMCLAEWASGWVIYVYLCTL